MINVINERKRVVNYGKFFAITMMLCLLYAITFEPNNLLWFIPIVACYFGTQIAVGKRESLDKRIKVALGSDEEEYF